MKWKVSSLGSFLPQDLILYSCEMVGKNAWCSPGLSCVKIERSISQKKGGASFGNPGWLPQRVSGCSGALIIGHPPYSSSASSTSVKNKVLTGGSIQLPGCHDLFFNREQPRVSPPLLSVVRHDCMLARHFAW